MKPVEAITLYEKLYASERPVSAADTDAALDRCLEKLSRMGNQWKYAGVW